MDQMEQREEIWSHVYEAMRQNNNQSAFNLWFADLVLSELTETRAVLTAKTVYKRNILRTSFKTKIEKYFEDVMGFPIEIEIISADEFNPPASAAAAESTAAEKKPSLNSEPENALPSERSSTVFAVNEEYTFDKFMVGNSNNLAYAACVAVAKSNGYDCNPLFIHGPSGLGKTHLLHAIINEIRAKKPNTNIVYATGEDFTNQLIRSISTRTTEQFRNKYRNADILMIDDIQFIAGRENTQEEFFHTFNALWDKTRQIILTSDRPANEIKPLTERLQSRFSWGVSADINPPDFELRAAILANKAESKGIELSTDIINMLAENLTDNIRQLEGAVKKLCAIKLLSDKPITLEVAMNSISDIISDRIPVNVTIDKIIAAVSKKYGVTEEQLKSKTRTSEITLARQVAFYLLYKTTDISKKKIGDILNRDHSTVISSISKVENEVKCNSLFEIEINELLKEIKNM